MQPVQILKEQDDECVFRITSWGAARCKSSLHVLQLSGAFCCVPVLPGTKVGLADPPSATFCASCCTCCCSGGVDERLSDVNHPRLFLRRFAAPMSADAPPPSAVRRCVHARRQEIIACPPHSTPNKSRVNEGFPAPSSHSNLLSITCSFSPLFPLSVKCPGSLSLLSLWRWDAPVPGRSNPMDRSALHVCPAE